MTGPHKNTSEPQDMNTLMESNRRLQYLVAELLKKNELLRQQLASNGAQGGESKAAQETYLFG